MLNKQDKQEKKGMLPHLHILLRERPLAISHLGATKDYSKELGLQNPLFLSCLARACAVGVAGAYCGLGVALFCLSWVPVVGRWVRSAVGCASGRCPPGCGFLPAARWAGGCGWAGWLGGECLG